MEDKKEIKDIEAFELFKEEMDSDEVNSLADSIQS